MSTINWVVFSLILLGALSLFLVLRESGKKAPARKPETSKTLEDFSFETSETITQFETSGAITKREPLLQQEHVTRQPNGELTFASSILTVMPRNPRSLYVYWEFVEQGEPPLQKLLNYHGPGAFPVLRIYELTEPHFANNTIRSYFDIPIDAGTDNWYVEVPHAGTIYCVELGIVLAGTGYISLLRSREVATPRNTISPRIDPDWLPLPGLQFGFGTPGKTLASSSLVQEVSGSKKQ